MRLIVASLLFLAFPGVGRTAGPPAVVSARTLLATNAVHPGTTVKVAVVARVEPGYHINDHKPSLDYLIPTKVTFDDSASLKVLKIVYPRGNPVKFEFLDSPISVYQGEFLLGTVLKVDRASKPGAYQLRGKLTYQACNDHACLPPASVPLEVTARVAPPAVALKPVNSEVFKKIKFN